MLRFDPAMGRHRGPLRGPGPTARPVTLPPGLRAKNSATGSCCARIAKCSAGIGRRRSSGSLLAVTVDEALRLHGGLPEARNYPKAREPYEEENKRASDGTQ
jgi:hypothetical protein